MFLHNKIQFSFLTYNPIKNGDTKYRVNQKDLELLKAINTNLFQYFKNRKVPIVFNTTFV